MMISGPLSADAIGANAKHAATPITAPRPVARTLFIVSLLLIRRHQKRVQPYDRSTMESRARSKKTFDAFR